MIQRRVIAFSKLAMFWVKTWFSEALTVRAPKCRFDMSLQNVDLMVSTVRLTKNSQISEKKAQIISRGKPSVFCHEHGIFPTYEINTSRFSVCGPFYLIGTKCGWRFFHKHW